LSEESEEQDNKQDSPQNGEEKNKPCTTLKLSENKTDKFLEQIMDEEENSKVNNNMNDIEDEEEVED
jgi:hypothetical protein